MARYTAARRQAHSSLLVLALLCVAALSFVLQWSSSESEAGARALQTTFVSGAPRSWHASRPVRIAMQSEKTDAIVEELKTLTLLEASELVKAIEDTFGVDASASAGAVMMAAPAAGGGEEEKAPEKTEFDVILKEVPKDKKIAILKVVRGILGVGLKEAKGMVDNPGKIMEGKPKDICDDAKTQLEEAGAVVAIE
uniref:Ribosomal protein L7/L12 C-terminal domain-containing protein n=1 Tax=Alexandrium andersonii TaxID=327968 RepID=A0A7S2IVE5_9DINO